MRWFHMAWLVAAVLTVAAACAPAVRLTAPLPMPASWSAGGGTGTIRADLGGAGFAVRAANKTVGDISYIVYQIYDVTLATVAASQSTVAQTVTFTSVGNGTYRLRAEAFGTAGSITLGGQQVSANTATVAGGITTYSSGGALSATLQLLHGTGESLAQAVSVTPGAAYAGSASGASWNPGVTLATAAVGTSPQAVTIDPSGNVWVANDGANSITKLSSAGALLGTYPLAGAPFAIAADPSGNIWVADRTNSQVVKFTGVGVSVGQVTVALTPRGLAIAPNGDVWVTSGGTTTLTRLTPGLTVAATVTLPAAGWGATADALGNVWVTHRTAGTLSKVSPAGTVLGNFACGSLPEGVRVMPTNQVWVACNNGNVVQRFSASGVSLGTSPMTLAKALDVDGAGNGVVVCGNGSLGLISPQGQVIYTQPIANLLAGVRVDGAGNAWVVDAALNQALKVSL